MKTKRKNSSKQPSSLLETIDYIQFIVIDLFCGAGGTTLGFEMADSGWEQFSNFLKANGIDHPKDKMAFFKMAEVVACVNHDPMAIISHHMNNNRVLHFEEDITKLYGFLDHGVLFKTPQFKNMLRLIEIYRAFYPHAKIILWASLECTNFSKAKGGMSRDADSRTLANHLFPYIIHLDPDYIQIENVVEFKEWGPLIPKVKTTKEGYSYCPLVQVKQKKKKRKNARKFSLTKKRHTADPDPILPKKPEEEKPELYYAPTWVPEPSTKGIWWLRWREAVNKLGYYDDWRQINAADHGAYTSRNRLFGCFAKNGLPMAWPTPSYGKKPQKSSIPLKKWKPVKEVLDFSDEGLSIFNRWKRIPKVKATKDGYQCSVLNKYDKEYKTFGPIPDPLSPNTMQRLFMGSVKHIGGGKDKFESRLYGDNPEHRNHDLESPAGALKTSNRLAIVNADFLLNYHHSSDSASIEDPSPTIVTHDKLAKVKAVFVSKAYSGSPYDKNQSIVEPVGSVTTKDHHQIVSASFIDQRNGGNLSTKSKSIHEPAKTLTSTGGNQQLVQASFISKYNGVNGGKHDNSHSINEPVGALSTKERHAKISATFLSTYNSNKAQELGGGNEGRSVEDPAPTITTGHTPTIVNAVFIDSQFSQGKQNQSVEDPIGALTTVPKHKLIQADFFIDKQYSGEDNHQSIEEPAGTILCNDKHNLVAAEKFIFNGNYNNNASGIEDPAPTITASRHHHYIVNPSWYGNSGSIEEPCHVVVARQDKAPLYLITCQEGGPIMVPIYEGDCPWTIKLKEFMALYNICDIKMRMLKEEELLPIQGFPLDYFSKVRNSGIKLSGTDAKKFIGNAVHPLVPKNMCEALNVRLSAHTGGRSSYRKMAA
jgi:DNA (cytosine-5)-methyltransferase 1